MCSIIVWNWMTALRCRFVVLEKKIDFHVETINW